MAPQFIGKLKSNYANIQWNLSWVVNILDNQPIIPNPEHCTGQYCHTIKLSLLGDHPTYSWLLYFAQKGGHPR